MSPTGRRVPLQEIASLSEGSSYNTIHRIDRRRTTTVSADTPRHTARFQDALGNVGTMAPPLPKPFKIA